MADENKAPAELTAEYCRGVKRRIVFPTASVEEATFVARQLQNLGFQFFSEHAKRLSMAPGGCIFLDTDKTIMVSSDRVNDGIDCTLDNFGGFFAKEGARAGSRLTAEDVATRTLVFYPRGFNESYRAVSVLATLGAAPGVGNSGLAALTLHAITYGLVVRGGRLSAGPVAEDLHGARICTMGDFGMPQTPDSAPPDNRSLLAAFNELSACIRRMEERLESVENELKPQTIDKPAPGLSRGL